MQTATQPRPRVQVVNTQQVATFSNRLIDKITAARHRAKMAGQKKIAYVAGLLLRAIKSPILGPALLKQGNYYDFNAKGRITYCPRGRQHKVDPDTGKWKVEGRQEMKAGKLANILRMNAHAEIVSKILSMGVDQVFEARCDDDIASVYGNAYHFKSCMTQEADLVGDYYSSAGAAVLYTQDADSNPTSRAVLWPSVTMVLYNTQTHEQKTVEAPYLDRKYGNYDLRNALANYAREIHGAWVKSEDEIHDTSRVLWVIDPNGHTWACLQIEATGVDADDLPDWTPYFDTFRNTACEEVPHMTTGVQVVTLYSGGTILSTDAAMLHDGRWARASETIHTNGVSPRRFLRTDPDLFWVRHSSGTDLIFHRSEIRDIATY